MFARGSILWFIRHELKVTWRTWFQRKGQKQRKRRFNVPAPVVAGIIFVLATAGLGVPLANFLRDVAFEATPLAAFIIDAALLLVFSLMLSQTLVAAVDVFYERGDLDLLLSSPIPPRRILAMRALAMSLSPALLFWAITLPFVLPMAVMGHPEILGLLVVIGGMALLATAIGLAIAIGLFSAIGPRRTRTVAQVLAAVVGAAFIIVAQIPNIVGVGDDEPVTTGWIVDLMNAETAPGWMRLPTEAVFGAPLPLLVFTAIALGGFALIVRWVGRRFARDAAAAAGADTVRKKKGRGEARFGATMTRATIAKELRMILRDPGLLSQVLLRVFYLVPLAIVILTDNRGDAVSIVPPIAAGAAALLAGQLAGSIAWIAISAEDAPGLLATAPHPIRAFWRAKLTATLLVPAILVGPVMILFAFYDPFAAAIGLVAAAASAWSAAMINLWLQKPTKRSEFRRSWSATFAASMLELISSLAFAAFAGLLVAGIGYAWIALAIAVLVVALARRSEAAVLERIAV